jgi:hypothetical protein
MWVPLCVESWTSSNAQPSPSGRSSAQPGKIVEQHRRVFGVGAVFDLRPHERWIEHSFVFERRGQVEHPAG